VSPESLQVLGQRDPAKDLAHVDTALDDVGATAATPAIVFRGLGPVVNNVEINFLKVARARLGSEPGIFLFSLFFHSITLPLSHSGSRAMSRFLASDSLVHPGPNPTTSIYNAGVVNCNAFN
jgi:hypothetical protein